MKKEYTGYWPKTSRFLSKAPVQILHNLTEVIFHLLDTWDKPADLVDVVNSTSDASMAAKRKARLIFVALEGFKINDLIRLFGTQTLLRHP
jgi:hypothetical protein